MPLQPAGQVVDAIEIGGGVEDLVGVGTIRAQPHQEAWRGGPIHEVLDITRRGPVVVRHALTVNSSSTTARPAWVAPTPVWRTMTGVSAATAPDTMVIVVTVPTALVFS